MTIAQRRWLVASVVGVAIVIAALLSLPRPSSGHIQTTGPQPEGPRAPQSHHSARLPGTESPVLRGDAGAPSSPSTAQVQLRGRCVRQDGPGVAGATVLIEGFGESEPEDAVIASGQTDFTGAFTINLPAALPRRLTVTASSPDTCPRRIPLGSSQLMKGFDLGDVVLSAGVLVSGVIDRFESLTAGSRPSALVWRLHPCVGSSLGIGSDAGGAVAGRALVNPDGTFQVGRLPAGWLECDVDSGVRSRAGYYRIPALQSTLAIVVRVTPVVGRRLTVNTGDGSRPDEIAVEPEPSVRRAPGQRWLLTPVDDERREWVINVSPHFGGPTIIRSPGYRSQAFMFVSGEAGLGDVLLMPGSDRVSVQLGGVVQGDRVSIGVLGRGAKATRFPCLTGAAVGSDGVVDVVVPSGPVQAGEAVLVIAADGRTAWRSREINDRDFCRGAAPVATTTVAAKQLKVVVDGSSDPDSVRVQVYRDSSRSPVRETSWGSEMFTSSGWVPVDDVVGQSAVGVGGLAELTIIPGFCYELVAAGGGNVAARATVGPELVDMVKLDMTAGGAVSVIGDASSGSMWGPPVLMDYNTHKVMAPISLCGSETRFAGVRAGRYLICPSVLARWAASLSSTDVSTLRGIDRFRAVDVVAGETTTVQFEVAQEPGWISGRAVSDSRGRPVTLVDIVPATMATDAPPSMNLGVSESGEFEVGAFPPGDYLLRLFDASARLIATKGVHVEPGAKLDLTVDVK